MPLLLQDVTFADGDAIANISISAFFTDPFQRTLFPDVPFAKQVEGMISQQPNNYGHISVYYKKVVDTDTGETVGYSKWWFAFTDAGGALRKADGGLAIVRDLVRGETNSGMTDVPEDVEVRPPSTAEGLNDAFKTDWGRKAVAIRERILGERPQLRESSASLHFIPYDANNSPFVPEKGRYIFTVSMGY